MTRMRSRKPAEIAPGVYWYSAGALAGNIYFVQSASSWALIDTATRGRGRPIREAAEPDAAPPELPEWTSIAAPGHSPGHTVFLRRDDRVLISGDALLTVDAGSLEGVLSWVLRPDGPRVYGPPWYTNWDPNQVITSAGAVIRLRPKIVAPGHGRPLSGDAVVSGLQAYTLAHGLMHAPGDGASDD